MCDLIGMTWLYCREVLMIFLDLLVKRVGNIPDRAARIGLFPPVELVCHSLRYGVKKKPTVRISRRWHVLSKLRRQ